MGSFYSTITASPYFDWLTEYDTSSPAQAIGHGSLGVTLTDAGAPTSATITDAAIHKELNRLFTAGQLPLPSANNYYAIYFPAGKNITQGGSTSCVDFCAYHGTYARSGQDVNYGVLPDLSGGCSSGCGTGTKINNTTSVSSHELVEAVTDPAVGLSTTFSSPLAWYDEANGEIGDICNAQQAVVSGFTVQKEFSNELSDCIATKASTPPPPTNCSHSVCSTGAKLVSGCVSGTHGTCSATICGADSFCCASSWDSQCVGEVGSICGQSCP